MDNYIVKTNKVGPAGSWWGGWVAYRLEDLNFAYHNGLNLECFCGEEEPKRMVVPHAVLFTSLKKRLKLTERDGTTYELCYYLWKPTHMGNALTPIDPDTPQSREPLPNQKALF